MILGYRFLQVLKTKEDIETHLVISKGAIKTWELEVDFPLEKLYELADHHHDVGNLAASISSGSFKTDGMIIAPCSSVVSSPSWGWPSRPS